MPEVGRGEPVDIVPQFVDEPALADAALADDRDQPQATVAFHCVKIVLEQAKFVRPADERRCEAIRPPRSPMTADHPDRLERFDRIRLALQVQASDRLEEDGTGRQIPGRPTDQDRTRRSGALQPGSDVDGVSDDQTGRGIPVTTDGGLPAQHARPRLQARHSLGFAELRYCLNEFQGRPDRSFGVVLVVDVCPPHRHDRVADVLVDHATESLDDLSRPIEVAGEHLPDLFGVALFGQRGESDDVDEHGSDEAPLLQFVAEG